MSKLSKPADILVRKTRGYVDAQIENVKLRTVKGLAQGTTALTGLLLIFIVAAALIISLSFAFVLWLGEMLDSYALAAFIVSGVLLLLVVILLLLRRRMFRNTFVSLFADVFFSEESRPKKLDSIEKVDTAIGQAGSRIKEEEIKVSTAFSDCKEYYRPRHLLSEGLRSWKWTDLMPVTLGILFRRRRRRR